MVPTTRIQAYLSRIAGNDTYLPPPITQEEIYLKQIAEQERRQQVEANPTLAGTEPDLTGLEVGGDKYKLPAGAFVCTFTKSGDTISCDKTAAEIDTAYKAGKAVIGIADYSWGDNVSVYGTAILNLTQVDYNNNQVVGVQFTSVVHISGDNISTSCDVFYLKGAKLLGSLRWSAGIVNTLEHNLIVELNPGSEANINTAIQVFVQTALTNAGQYTRTTYSGSISEFPTILGAFPYHRILLSLSNGGFAEVTHATSSSIGLRIALAFLPISSSQYVSISCDVIITSSNMYFQGFAELAT